MNSEEQLKKIAELLNCDIEDVPERVRKLKKETEEQYLEIKKINLKN